MPDEGIVGRRQHDRAASLRLHVAVGVDPTTEEGQPLIDGKREHPIRNSLGQRKSVEAKLDDPLGQRLRVHHDPVFVGLDATQPEHVLDDPCQLSPQFDVGVRNGELNAIGLV